jgi:hypothetical protein
MTEDEKKLSIALPGEWALQKVLGPTLTEIGSDLQKLYAKGRDRIIAKAYRKIPNPEDGKRANLRVTRDALWGGAFTEDEVCAEYFGGVLASSRSEDGKDDAAIQFVDVIKSLSSKQLRLHYIIYNALNKLLVRSDKRVNVAQGTEIQTQQVWFSAVELLQLQIPIDTDLNILHRQSLLYRYETDVHTDEQKVIPYASANPTTFGVLLYSAAHARLAEWRAFDREDFGDFSEIKMPAVYASSLAELTGKAGFTIPPSPSEREA